MFPKIGVPQSGWFIVENPIKMDDLGVPLFLETYIYIYIYIYIYRRMSFWKTLLTPREKIRLPFLSLPKNLDVLLLLLGDLLFFWAKFQPKTHHFYPVRGPRSHTSQLGLVVVVAILARTRTCNFNWLQEKWCQLACLVGYAGTGDYWG